MGWETSATDHYKLCGFDIQTDMVFNSGILVMQPKKHNDFLLTIYNKYILQSISHPRGFIFEQSCIGYELQKHNLYKIIDNKVVYFEDHVFPIIKKNNSWFAADSFYYKKSPYSIYYQDVRIKVIKKEELPMNAPLEMKEAKVVLRCGKIYRDNKIAGEIYNIPKYFTNNYNVIEADMKINQKLFYMYNRPILIKDYYQDLKFPLWNFNNWCKNS
jgi:hypothetical protein